MITTDVKVDKLLFASISSDHTTEGKTTYFFREIIV